MNKSGDQKHLTWGRRASRLCLLASSLALVALSLGVAAVTANANPPALRQGLHQPEGAKPFTVNGTDVADLNNLKQGDHVVVHFTIAADCTNVEVTFASYNGTTNDIPGQTPFSHDTQTFSTGDHTLAIDIPCVYQADFAFGPWIDKFTTNPSNFYGERLISTGSGSSPCVTPTPTPTESIQASSTPTSSISATSSPSTGHQSVLGASVTNPNTGNGSEAFAGFVAMLMVLTGIAVLAEVRRRRISS